MCPVVQSLPQPHVTQDGQVNLALMSGVSSSPADGLLRDAITSALQSEPAQRAQLLTRLLGDIQAFMKERAWERPWTFTILAGTDGSCIFRGGTGHSLVVDPAGNVWKARSYEDFDTEYRIEDSECTITALTPKYREMRLCSSVGVT